MCFEIEEMEENLLKYSPYIGKCIFSIPLITRLKGVGQTNENKLSGTGAKILKDIKIF